MLRIYLQLYLTRSRGKHKHKDGEDEFEFTLKKLTFKRESRRVPLLDVIILKFYVDMEFITENINQENILLNKLDEEILNVNQKIYF